MIKYTTLLILLFCFSCSNNENNGVDKDEAKDCNSHCDLSKTTPTKFLQGLKKTLECNRHLVICNPVDNWISKNDIPFLIPYLDSNSVIATPVYSTLASITIDNHGQSTLANEAYSLIIGYRTGKYPPYGTIPLGGDRFDTYKLEDSLKTEVLNWWNKEQMK